MEDLDRQKDLTGGQDRNCLRRATRSGAWISAVPHRLNGTKLSWEEFQDNLCLRYELMSQEISATCDGCGERFLIKNALSCPKGGLVLARNDDAAKKWGTIVARALLPSAISYIPKKK